jgi:hypothetical protein
VFGAGVFDAIIHNAGIGYREPTQLGPARQVIQTSRTCRLL